MIDWKSISKADLDLALECALRAHGLFPETSINVYWMDISAAHINSPLRLRDLLESDEFNFIHDVLGINKHINRKTGRMNDCFFPRYSA